MQAVVIHGPGDYRLKTLPVPEPGPKEILVKVKAVGVCASDGKCYSGAEVYWGKPGKPGKIRLPITPGHEFSGQVVKLGQGASEHHRVKIGDVIVAEQIVTCGSCRFCLRGNYEVCNQSAIYGFSPKYPGAMAQFMIFTQNSRVHRVPENVDPILAAFAEPLSCGLHGVESAGININDIVVVSGCGPVGLSMISGAKHKSPKCLIALDLVDWKLDIAKKCGADYVINVGNCQSITHLKQEIGKLCGGDDVTVYMEVSGSPVSVHQGLQLLAPLGKFVCYSVFRDAFPADWSIIGDVKELQIIGAHLGRDCWPRALEMIGKEGVLPLEDIITHRLSLKDVNEALDLVVSGRNSVKVMILPNP